MDNQALAAKIIARRLYCHYDNPDFDSKPLTSTQLQFGKVSENFAELSRTLFEKKLKFTAKKFADEDVNKLLAILRPRIKDLERPPIICIDYLQRLIPRVNKLADTRSLIDDALFKLKDFSTETNSLLEISVKKHFSLVAKRRVGALLFFFASEKESTFIKSFIFFTNSKNF